MYIYVCVIVVFDIFFFIGESLFDFFVWIFFDLIDIDLKLICFLKKSFDEVIFVFENVF